MSCEECGAEGMHDVAMARSRAADLGASSDYPAHGETVMSDRAKSPAGLGSEKGGLKEQSASSVERLLRTICGDDLFRSERISSVRAWSSRAPTPAAAHVAGMVALGDGQTQYYEMQSHTSCASFAKEVSLSKATGRGD